MVYRMREKEERLYKGENAVGDEAETPPRRWRDAW